MSSTRGASKTLLILAGLLALASLVSPSAMQILGPLAVFLGLVAIYSLTFKRPVGRPSSDSARRLSGYLVRPNLLVIPEAVLLGLAVWEILFANSATVPGFGGLAILGFVLGLVWGISGRVPMAHEIGKVLIGGVALVFSLASLVRAEGGAPLSHVGMALLVATVVASVAVAVLLGFLRRATLRRSNLGSYLLAVLGLISLVQFALAPAGQYVLGGAPLWAQAALAVGLVVICLVGAVNPIAAEAMVGSGVAVGSCYLVLVGARLEAQEGVSTSVSAHEFVLVGVFSLIVCLTAGAASPVKVAR